MTRREISNVQKSTVVDLYAILREDPAKSYTVDELWKIMTAYVDREERRLCHPKK